MHNNARIRIIQLGKKDLDRKGNGKKTHNQIPN